MIRYARNFGGAAGWSGKTVIDVTDAFMLPPRSLDLRAATDVVRSETLAECPGEFPLIWARRSSARSEKMRAREAGATLHAPARPFPLEFGNGSGGRKSDLRYVGGR
jgi:hypothetical protein